MRSKKIWEDRVRRAKERIDRRRARVAAKADRLRRAAEYRDEHRDEVVAKGRRFLLASYGLTPERYDQMLAEQGGVCAICKLPPTRSFNVDHDHRTGEVRGLLCGLCNSGIGLLRDDPGIVQSALDYLRRHSS